MIRRPLGLIRRGYSRLFPLNFITVHYAYFICTSLLSSVIFWASSTPARSVSYTDSLFLTVSALTLSGLNVVNLSPLNTFQETILFLLTIVGSAILISFVVILVRRDAFRKRFRSIVQEQKSPVSRRIPPFTVMKSISPRLAHPPSSGGNQVPLHHETATPQFVITEASAEDIHASGAMESPPGDREGAQRDLNFTGSQTDISLEKPSVTSDDDSPLDDRDCPPEEDDNHKREATTHITFDPSIQNPHHLIHRRIHRRPSLFSVSGVGARRDGSIHPSTSAHQTSGPLRSSRSFKSETEATSASNAYLGVEGLQGRNSQFYGLTSEDRRKLGGVEYRALSLLAAVVPIYIVVWQVLGAISIGAWIARNRPDSTKANGLNPWWVGIFNAISAFNNNGMSLLDANMTAYQTSTFMLLGMSLLILAGNTCYPVFLRLVLWTWKKLLPGDPKYDDRRTTLQFLLDHPRRCYTHLFPSQHTWWLVGSLFLLNGIDWAMFQVLTLGDPDSKSLSMGRRVVVGLFQTVAIRSGGFYAITVATLPKSLLVLYVLMMYISVYPVVITMRHSNVYEERSLGIYSSENDPSYYPALNRGFFGSLQKSLSVGSSARNREPRGYFVRQQLRGQLAHDLWWVALAVLLICIIENSAMDRDPIAYSVFNIIFEVISAYGTVGLSVGLPNQDYSFCGGWHTLSKLILCAVMIRGRHRGLPVAIDRAVLLPGEHLARAEEEDALRRTESMIVHEAGSLHLSV
ncbi:hypothetical protein AJ80_01547 [Polytolypa hystricis UAMH7299]|uniref:Potassium transport protein n=1 Tax=Polytolypa hystricis (strain UAMH7299) TaxID=1447883 RepID=A0A2B7Z122_POLH7|nr:hypothetical protein AJ80_01547 [Polytolypa hystricis UAMH7299]